MGPLFGPISPYVGSMMRLAGTRFAVDNWRDLRKLSVMLGTAFGPLAATVVAAAEDQDLHGLDKAQRAWGSEVSRRLELAVAVSGLEKVAAGPYVVVALHEGFADALALLRLPLSLSWVGRDELTDWPRLGSYLRSAAAIVINPETPRRAYRDLNTGAARIFEMGRSLVVYPQGTLLGIETAFRRGAFSVADRHGVQILPVVVNGAAKVYEHPFSPLIRFGQTITMQVLDPVPAGRAVESFAQIESTMKQLAVASTPAPRHYVPERDGWWDGYSFDIHPNYPELSQQVGEHRMSVAADEEVASVNP